jgi:hypothetical protein
MQVFIADGLKKFEKLKPRDLPGFWPNYKSFVQLCDCGPERCYLFPNTSIAF